MGKYSFVLSDTLYKQYYLFKEHQDYDKDILLHLLKFRCGEFLTNTRQLDDIGIGDRVSKSLYDSLKQKNMPVRSIPECLQGCLEIDFAEQKSRTCLSFEAFE